MGKVVKLQTPSRLALATTVRRVELPYDAEKDGVCYMYDRVTKRLFGNEGTCEFVLGAEKTD